MSSSIFDGVFGRSAAIASRISQDGTSDTYNELIEKLSGDDGVKVAYIAEKGINVKPEYKTKQYHKYGNEALEYIKGKLSVQKVAEYAANVYTGNFSEQNENEIRKMLLDYWIKDKKDERSIRIWTNRANKLTKLNIEDLVLATEQYIEEDGKTKSDEIDRWATLDNVNEIIKSNKEEYKNWLKEKTNGIVGEAGVYNGKDPYTASGDRKEFWKLHNPLTLENIVKAMNNEADRGVGLFGGGAKALQATATQKYSSIDEIKADKNRLKKLSTEEHEKILESLDERIDKVVRNIQEYNNDVSYMS